MQESVVATFNNVKFIRSTTSMTQANWQEYFGNAIQSGVYSGLEQRNYNGSTVYTNGRRLITDGVVFANGIYAKLETEDGYTDIGAFPSGVVDRMIVVRVYYGSETAELVQKTGLAEVSTGIPAQDYLCQHELMNLTFDESRNCVRNSEYYEIPIFYQGRTSTFLSEGKDLRRMVCRDTRKPAQDTNNTGIKSPESNVILLKGNDNVRLTTAGTYKVYVDSVDQPFDAMIYYGTGSVDTYTFEFSQYPFSNNDIATYASSKRQGSNGNWSMDYVSDQFLNESTSGKSILTCSGAKTGIVRVSYAGIRSQSSTSASQEYLVEKYAYAS